MLEKSLLDSDPEVASIMVRFTNLPQASRKLVLSRFRSHADTPL